MDRATARPRSVMTILGAASEHEGVRFSCLVRSRRRAKNAHVALVRGGAASRVAAQRPGRKRLPAVRKSSPEEAHWLERSPERCRRFPPASPAASASTAQLTVSFRACREISAWPTANSRAWQPRHRAALNPGALQRADGARTTLPTQLTRASWHSWHPWHAYFRSRQQKSPSPCAQGEGLGVRVSPRQEFPVCFAWTAISGVGCTASGTGSSGRSAQRCPGAMRSASTSAMWRLWRPVKCPIC